MIGHLSLARMWEKYKSGGDILVFLGIWLASTIFIGQDRAVVKGDWYYWLAVVPAMVFPLIRFSSTMKNLLFGKARPLAFFGVLGVAWAVLNQDFAVAAPIILIVWVGAWACRDEAVLLRRSFFLLILAFYALGIMAFLLQPPFERFPWMGMPYNNETLSAEELPAGADPTPKLPDQVKGGLDLNPWGILPGQTAPAFGHWRISMTPKIATSGLVSLFALLIFLQKPSLRPTNFGTAALAAYFAFLSLIRAVSSAAALFLVTYILQKLFEKSTFARIVMAVLTTTGLIAATWIAPYLLYKLQDYDIVSRLMLRGRNDLSFDEIVRQLYRSWLWTQHFNIFIDSRYFMGVGSELAQSAKEHLLNANQARSDSDSFLTRLLATYGVATFGLFYFFIERCFRHARKDDLWAISMLSVLLWLMMTWGSSFHPTNGIFVLAFLVIGKGSNAFRDEMAASTASDSSGSTLTQGCIAPDATMRSRPSPLEA